MEFKQNMLRKKNSRSRRTVIIIIILLITRVLYVTVTNVRNASLQLLLSGRVIRGHSER